MLPSLGVGVFLVYFFGFILHDKQDKSDGYKSFEEHYELEGQFGYAKTDLRPGGIAIIDGKRYDVVSEGEFICKGTPIQVVEIRDGKIIVRKVQE